MLHALVAARNALREPEPRAARIVGIFFTVITAGICTSLFTHRVSSIRSWRRLSYIRWLVIAQYVGVFLYILIAAVLQYAYDPNVQAEACSGAAIICVVVYGLIKMLFYLFLADRLHVVRASTKSRTRSRLFLFHTAGIAVGIAGMIVVFSVLRINDNQNGQCVIGVSRYIMLTGVCIDFVLNVYLTAFFLYYLSKSFSLRPSRGIRSPDNLVATNSHVSKLGTEIRSLAKRTVIGLAISLAATISNLIATIVMNGEVYWLCFLTCKADILIGVIVLYWITSGGRGGHNHSSGGYYGNSSSCGCGAGGGGSSRTRAPSSLALDPIGPAKPTASYEAHLRLNNRRSPSATAPFELDDYDDDALGSVTAVTGAGTGTTGYAVGKTLPLAPTSSSSPGFSVGRTLPLTPSTSTALRPPPAAGAAAGRRRVQDKDSSDDDEFIIQGIQDPERNMREWSNTPSRRR